MPTDRRRENSIVAVPVQLLLLPGTGGQWRGDGEDVLGEEGIWGRIEDNERSVLTWCGPGKIFRMLSRMVVVFVVYYPWAW